MSLCEELLSNNGFWGTWIFLCFLFFCFSFFHGFSYVSFSSGETILCLASLSILASIWFSHLFSIKFLPLIPNAFDSIAWTPTGNCHHYLVLALISTATETPFMSSYHMSSSSWSEGLLPSQFLLRCVLSLGSALVFPTRPGIEQAHTRAVEMK